MVHVWLYGLVFFLPENGAILTESSCQLIVGDEVVMTFIKERKEDSFYKHTFLITMRLERNIKK